MIQTMSNTKSALKMFSQVTFISRVNYKQFQVQYKDCVLPIWRLLDELETAQN